MGYKIKEIYVWSQKVRPSWPIERPDLDQYSLLWTGSIDITYIHGIAVSPDGTKLYAWPASSRIKQYTLTWWLITWVSAAESQTSWTVYTRWLYVKPDWSMLYSVSDNTRGYNITMPTVYSLTDSSSTYTNINWIVDNNNPVWVWLTPDGEYFFTCRNQKVYKVKLNTAWDLTTYTSTWSTEITLTQPTYFYNVAISPTWLKMFGWWDNTIYQYNLSTAWDITTATYSWKSLSVTWRCTFSVTENWDIFQTPTDGTSNIYQYRAS